MREDKSHCICPAGKRLYRNGGNVIVDGNRAFKFRGRKTDCRICAVRKRCLRNPDTSEVRQVYFIVGRSESATETFTQKIKQKIDSIKGRLIYNRRLGTVSICPYPIGTNIGQIHLERETEGRFTGRATTARR